MSGWPARATALEPRDFGRATLLLGAALALYLALGQRLMHGFDAFYYLRDVDAGQLHHPRMALYLPLAYAFTKALNAFGVCDYEAMRALSGVFAAIGVACVHLAALRLGLGRARALVAAAAAASLPAVLYSASVVEVDAVLMGLSCACWLPFSRALLEGRWSAAMATGAVSGIAACCHASGHLLALSLCGLCLGFDWPRRKLGPSLLLAAWMLAAHLAVSTAVVLWLDAWQQGEMVTNTVGHGFPLDFVPHVALHEWLIPYAPVGLLGLWLLRTRRDHATGLAFAAVLCGYVFVSTKILGYQRYAKEFLSQGNVVERGSFLLALAAPMALFAVRALPLRVVLACALLGSGSGVWQIRTLDWPDDPEGAAAAVGQALAEGPIEPFVADTQEWAWISRRWPQVRCTLLGMVVTDVAAARAVDPAVVTPDMVLLWFAMEYDRAIQRGAQYVVTQRALDAMRAGDDPAIAPAAARLQDLYRFDLILESGPLRAYRLTRR